MPVTIYALFGQCRPGSQMVSIRKDSYACVISIEIKEEGDNKKKKVKQKRKHFFLHTRGKLSYKISLKASPSSY